MAQVVPYINFADKGREAIEFYKGVFGGDAEMTLIRDGGMADQMPAEWGERIMHFDFKAGNVHFFGSDIISDQAGLDRGNGYKLAITCDSDEQLRDYYDKLAAGGNEVMAPADSSWGAIYAECSDKFGVQWMLNYDKPQA